MLVKMHRISAVTVFLVGLSLSAYTNGIGAEENAILIQTLRGDLSPTKVVDMFTSDESEVKEFGALGLARPVGCPIPRGISLGNDLVSFTPGSYSLTSETKKVLDNIGIAMTSDQLRNSLFLIEGHTDSVGSRHYNQWLSERRAETAKNYLVNKMNVEAHRILTLGRGPDVPLNKEDPTSPENRRIVIIRLY
jgi:outer membrane protein OmpA-like peptidoglycan-associated protein